MFLHHNNSIKWQVIVGSILISQMLTIAAFTVTVPILPLILQDFFQLEGSTLTRWTSYLSTGPSIAMMLLMPVWGILADKFGKRLMLVRALATGVIIIGLMSFVQSPAQLLLLQTLQGGFTGSIAAATVLILFYTPKSHTISVLALLQVAIFLGKSLGPMIGGIVYDYFGGRLNFPITVVILLLALANLLIFVPKDQPQVKEKKINTASSQRTPLPPFLFFLLASTFTVALAFSLINGVFVLFVKESISSIAYLSDKLGQINGFIMASANLAIAVGALAFSRLSKWIKMEYTLLIAILGAGLLYLPQLYVSEWQGILLIRTLESFFVGGVTPAIQYFISRYTPSHRQGTIFGINRSVDGLGLAVGPLLGATLVNSHNGSFDLLFISGSVILLTLALFFLLVIQKEKQHSPQLICSCNL